MVKMLLLFYLGRNQYWMMFVERCIHMQVIVLNVAVIQFAAMNNVLSWNQSINGINMVPICSTQMLS